jgi:sulfite oxidase
MFSAPYASRRDFLRASAALAGAFSLPRLARAAADDLIVRSADPYNAEPALAELVAANITPVKHFYVRNHGPTPKIEASGYKIRIEGLVNKPAELSPSEIKERFRQHSAEATLTCAGNRRKELSQIKEVSGVQWDAGAIGNARWSGASLADILRFSEIKEGAKHVWFEAHDPIKEKDGSVAPFGGSITLQKALAGDGPSLIAHAMNDEPLTAEHGHPLRMVVPGYIGARSVKWLTKITVSDRPSPNHYLAEAYKLIQTESKDEVAAANPIYDFSVNAAICSPAAGATLKAGKTTLSGYALASGEPGCTIAKVEVSRDGGRNWIEAKLVGASRPFIWQLWTADIDLSAGRHDLVVCATDSRGNMMPQRGAWNLKGYLYNGWHRVTVEAT